MMALRVIIPCKLPADKSPLCAATSAMAESVERIAATTSHTESPGCHHYIVALHDISDDCCWTGMGEGG